MLRMRVERPQSFSMSKKKKHPHKTQNKKQKPNNKVNIVLSKKEMKDNGKRKYVDIRINN